VRYDWLAHYLFDSIEEVQDYATRWLWTYSHERPNTAIGGITPKQKLALADSLYSQVALKMGGLPGAISGCSNSLKFDEGHNAGSLGRHSLSIMHCE
jgi:hypothetical protein